MKFCRMCGCERPKTEFGISRQRPDGLQPLCRFHHKENVKRSRLLSDAKAKTLAQQMTEGHKVCPDCGHDKPLSDFNKMAARKDGYQCFCRECQKIRNREWKAQHKGIEINEPTTSWFVQFRTIQSVWPIFSPDNHDAAAKTNRLSEINRTYHKTNCEGTKN